MLIVSSLSIGSDTCRPVGRRGEDPALGRASGYLHLTRPEHTHIHTFSASKSKKEEPRDASGEGGDAEGRNLASPVHPKISHQEPPASMRRIPEEI